MQLTPETLSADIISTGKVNIWLWLNEILSLYILFFLAPNTRFQNISTFSMEDEHSFSKQNIHSEELVSNPKKVVADYEVVHVFDTIRDSE